MKKYILLSLLATLTFNFCNAQFYKTALPSPEFSTALQKIVLDFRVNFASIQGTAIVQQSEAEIYESTVKLPGATDCVIYKYHSKADTTASWQAIMYRGDDYKEASKVYENVFKQVRKTRIQWIDKSIVGFSGEIEKPSESLRFSVSTLRLELDDNRYKLFMADIELLTNYNGWEVRVNLQTKRPDNAK